MRTTMGRRRTRLPEEDAFELFNQVFDFEVYCLELEYSETIGEALREGVKRALDRKQRAFDAMLARHPATLAENARRAEARRLEKERLEGIATRRKERDERRRRAGVRRLVRRWGAKLVSARAG